MRKEFQLYEKESHYDGRIFTWFHTRVDGSQFTTEECSPGYTHYPPQYVEVDGKKAVYFLDRRDGSLKGTDTAIVPGIVASEVRKNGERELIDVETVEDAGTQKSLEAAIRQRESGVDKISFWK